MGRSAPARIDHEIDPGQEIYAVTATTLFLSNASMIGALVTALWLLSVKLRDVSIVDIFWGLGFVLVAALSTYLGSGWLPRRALIGTLTAIWGLRLALHLAVRNLPHGEDARYVAIRESFGDSFWWQSYVIVFLFQGLLILIISAPHQACALAEQPASWTLFDALGVALWLLGFVFEALGDWQLVAFKSKPENQGKVLDTGLWRLTRHPNYFGDFCLWWGFFAISLSTAAGPYLLFSPLIMSFLLMKVSGVPLLERSLKKRRPEYEDYIRRTNAFFPWFPKTKDSA